MQKWEYSVVGQSGGGGGMVNFADVTKKTVFTTKGEPLLQFLARIGADGWEMVLYSGDAGGGMFWFKRPKQ